MDHYEEKVSSLLLKLGRLSTQLSDLEADVDFLNEPMDLIREVMHLEMCVLYKVTNAVDGLLLLEILNVYDPNNRCEGMVKGQKICLSQTDTPREFINEVKAFQAKGASTVFVPGKGCDIAGFIPNPGEPQKGFLLACDQLTDVNEMLDYEVAAFQLICNMLSTALVKEHFEFLANYDELTGLLNKRAIKRVFNEMIERHRGREAKFFSILVMIDIDHFKQVNDTYGHIQGDIILEEFAGILKESVRTMFDSVGRYGGEEFLLILPSLDKDTVFVVIDRIRNQVEHHAFTKVNKKGSVIENDALHITASFGVLSITTFGENDTVSSLISRADEALYQSKENGRNKITVC